MTTDDLRDAFLDFFVSKGCALRDSDVLVPRDDPTVLFTPAGMNQFKREFMGLGDPDFKRAVTCQKCIRTGDIENVGKTGRHMTFFEMLGNFSFGDYFKREAIAWAWEFLTKTLAIDPARLTVSVYEEDDEAFDIWRREIGLATERIVRMGEDDNFWPAGAPSHGPNGVCGPCSEIFYHYDDGREVEIWNLVFTQFNRVGPKQLEPLPSKNIDTGMGLERAAACLQGVGTVFETDIFKPLIDAVSEVLGQRYEADSPDGIRIRRAADHARALTFTIHENVQPSNKEEGYVVRRLLRRAVLDAYLMGRREPYLYHVIPAVAVVMKRPYPELESSVRRIQHIVREEEEHFLRTIENGLRLFDDTVRTTRAAGSSTISGAAAFKLHATHGFPIEMTLGLAAEHDLGVNMEEFEQERDRHAKASGQDAAAAVFETGPLDALKQEYHQGTEFLGYETTEAGGKIIGIVAQGRLVESEDAGEGPPIALILDRSPFYGEAGGQIGDTGTIEGDGFRFQVEDTQRDRGFILHIGHVTEGEAHLYSQATTRVDRPRREAIRRAHSATHLLHHALHEVLGPHAQQAGSKVEPDRLRFDFANPEPLGRERLLEIERRVNDRVLEDAPVRWRTMPLEEAKRLGAMALFGEKYPEIVRVVEMGDFSKELCGGTHLDHVGRVGLFKVIGEESVAAGTRRVIALAGAAALEHVHQEEATLFEVASALKVPPKDVAARISSLLEEIKTLKKQAGSRQATPKISADELLAKAVEIAGARVIATSVESVPADELRRLIDAARRKAGGGLAALLMTTQGGKVLLAAGSTPDLVERGFHSGLWLKPVASKVGGGGGGKPDFAQAGGKQPDRIPEALETALETARQQLEAG